MLQKELEHIYAWTRKNNATFNSDKFEYIHCRKQALIPEDLPVSGLISSSSPISRTLASGCQPTFPSQSTYVLSPYQGSSNLRNYIICDLRSRNTDILLPILKSIIRWPHLDYACPIRNPSDSASVNLLENEQSFFTSKFATFRRYNLDLRFRRL